MTTESLAHPSPVLVVEDEALLRLNVDDFLKAAGFEVIEAADANSALRIMTQRPDVRVLFTDILFNSMES